MSRTGPVVVALSGGGAKAAAHIGALRALEEAGLAPARLVGTSMGAVVAAGYAAGLGPDELLARLGGLTRKQVAVPHRLAALGGLWLPALLRAEPLRRMIAGAIPATRFAELRLPLTVTAVDLDSGALLLFGDGQTDPALAGLPLADVLYASCALPLYYPPAALAGRRLGDGGLRGVVPFAAVAQVAADAGLVVAVDIGSGFDDHAPDGALPGNAPPPGPAMVRAHDDATGILMAELTASQLALWRATPGRPPLVYVRPRVERRATFRLDRAAHYAEEGYRAVREALAASDEHDERVARP